MLLFYACEAACKADFIDSMVGAASLMLKANGLEKNSNFRQKIEKW